MNNDNQMSLDGASPTAQKRVAILMRSAIVDPESLNHQEQICREYALNNDWVVGVVRGEAGRSGVTLEDRPALHSLMLDAKRQPRPFDILLVDEVSRLSRNVGEVFTIAECLETHGIRLQIVNPTLSSNDPNFRLMLVCSAMGEESYKERLRNQVHKSVVGRVRMGYSAGGTCFGFHTVPDAANGHRAGGEGRKLEILESEAATVRRIFDLYSTGSSFLRIARTLSDEQVPTPRSNSSWNPTTVGWILRNPVYIGKLTWNKTRQAIHPITGKRVKFRNRPEAWVHVTLPGLRVISDESWNQVQDRLKTAKRKLASQDVGQPLSEHVTVSTSPEVEVPEPEELSPRVATTSDHRTHA